MRLVLFPSYDATSGFALLTVQLVEGSMVASSGLGVFPSGKSVLQYYGSCCYIHKLHFVNRFRCSGNRFAIVLNTGTRKWLRGESHLGYFHSFILQY